MTVVTEATPPTNPSLPRARTLVPFAGGFGLLAGIALAFLLENFDTRLHSSGEIEAVTALPVLGKIPTAAATRGVVFPTRSPQEEAFRRLRTNLLARDAGNPVRSVLVTSASAGDGKSTTVANLALAMAQSGRRVVVVDADMRKPTMHGIFGASNVLGLSSVLSGQVTLDEALQFSMTPGIQVLSSGPASPNPAELLGLQQMDEVVRALERQYDVVLVDTPSLETVTDAAILSLVVDAVLLVVARGHSRREVVVAALQELEHVQCVPLGVVVTRAEGGAPTHYGSVPSEQSAVPSSETSASPPERESPQPLLTPFGGTAPVAGADPAGRRTPVKMVGSEGKDIRKQDGAGLAGSRGG